MLFQLVALAVLALLAGTYHRLERVTPTPEDWAQLRQRNSCVPRLLKERSDFDRECWEFRRFGLRLLSALFLPLRHDLKAICRDGWMAYGFLLAFYFWYSVLWLKNVVTGTPRDLRVILALQPVATPWKRLLFCSVTGKPTDRRAMVPATP